MTDASLPTSCSPSPVVGFKSLGYSNFVSAYCEGFEKTVYEQYDTGLTIQDLHKDSALDALLRGDGRDSWNLSVNPDAPGKMPSSEELDDEDLHFDFVECHCLKCDPARVEIAEITRFHHPKDGRQPCLVRLPPKSELKHSREFLQAVMDDESVLGNSSNYRLASKVASPPIHHGLREVTNLHLRRETARKPVGAALRKDAFNPPKPASVSPEIMMRKRS